MTYFLTVSGFISSNKRLEFEQTFRFVSNQLPPDCLQFSLAADIFIADKYHFYSLWQSAESLDSFCKSQEFRVVEGVFHALGSQEQDIRGKEVNIRSFELFTNTQPKI